MYHDAMFTQTFQILFLISSNIYFLPLIENKCQSYVIPVDVHVPIKCDLSLHFDSSK